MVSDLMLDEGGHDKMSSFFGGIGAIGAIGLDERQAADYLSLLLKRVMKSMDAPKMEFPVCRFAMAAIRKNL